MHFFFIFDPKWRVCKVYSLCFVAIFGHFQNALMFRKLAVFSSRFCVEQLQCVVETFWPCSYTFSIFDKVYSFCLVAIFKILSFFEYKLFFRAVSCIEQLQSAVEILRACFYAFLIFDPKWRCCKVYSLCLVAIFGHFQNALIFRILAVFSTPFLHRATAMCCRNVFSMFFCIFNFWLKVNSLKSLKVLSLCLVAIFGQFQNTLIFRILASFSRRPLHKTIAMCCRNAFSMFLCIFDFWLKVNSLKSL